MDHAITVRDVLRMSGIVIALTGVGGGVLIALAGGFEPAPGPKDARNSGIGCAVAIISALVFAALLRSLF